MIYPIVASDLDGTLLNEHHSLSPFAKNVLTQLTKQGIHFIFATGRHHLDVNQRRESMGIPAYMVTSNGATIHDEKGNLILEQKIPAHLVFDLLKLGIDDPHLYTNVFIDQKWLINKSDASIAPFLVDVDFTYEVADLFSLDKSDIQNVHKVFFTISDLAYRSHLENLKQRIEAEFDEVDVTFSSLHCLDVMLKGVNKGSAIEFIAHRLNHSIKDVIAFGDSMNDYEMLSSVGKGFLMENANPDIKAALPDLSRIGLNSEEAVPHYLHSLYKL